MKKKGRADVSAPAIFYLVPVLHLKLKHRYSIWRKRICEGIFLSVTFLLHCFIDQRPRLTFSAVPLIVTVQDQLILLALGTPTR